MKFGEGGGSLGDPHRLVADAPHQRAVRKAVGVAVARILVDDHHPRAREVEHSLREAQRSSRHDGARQVADRGGGRFALGSVQLDHAPVVVAEPPVEDFLGGEHLLRFGEQRRGARRVDAIDGDSVAHVRVRGRVIGVGQVVMGNQPVAVDRLPEKVEPVPRPGAQLCRDLDGGLAVMDRQPVHVRRPHRPPLRHRVDVVPDRRGRGRRGSGDKDRRDQSNQGRGTYGRSRGCTGRRWSGIAGHHPSAASERRRAPNAAVLAPSHASGNGIGCRESK